MAKTLTTRGKVLRWLTNHRGCTEQPPNSNRDNRKDGITAAQRRLAPWLYALAWCGTWVANALMAAGIKGAKNPALASVAACEDLARKRAAPYGRGYLPVSAGIKTIRKRVLRGDSVILFGRGVHIATVRSIKWYPILGWCVNTDEGNTSPGNSGSQANGGGSYPRRRPLSQVHGFCLVSAKTK